MYAGFFVIARTGAIDFFHLTTLDDDYELERKMIAEGHSLAPDLIVVNDVLIASDRQQALIVYRIQDDSIVRISDDTSPKHLNKLAAVNNLIFAASYSDAVYCYMLTDDGSIREVGSFQCDSPVLSFCAVDHKMLYGTAGGAIGAFEEITNKSLARLRDALENEQLTLKPDRSPPADFEWQQPPLFVDFDTLAIVRKLPLRDSVRILTAAQIDEETLAEIPE
jgi:hypothetical protein